MKVKVQKFLQSWFNIFLFSFCTTQIFFSYTNSFEKFQVFETSPKFYF